MFDWLIAMQRWLYGGMSDGIKSTVGISGLPGLMGAALLFGVAHALTPGHGKSVLVSYHLGRPTKLLEGVVTGTLLAVSHVGMAVVLVLSGIAVISRSVATGGRAPAFEVASAALITLIGLYLIARAIRPAEHAHASDGRALAVFAGLVSCPLTTFILTYAFAHDKLAVGFIAVLAMLAGVIVTLVSFAVAAVVARQQFMSAMNRTETLRQRLGFWLELAGAAAVFVLGATMLWDRLGTL